MLLVKAESLRYLLLLLMLTWMLSACSGQKAAAVTPTLPPATPTQAPPPTPTPAPTNTPIPTAPPKPTAVPTVEPTEAAEAPPQAADDLDARSLPQFADAEVIYEDKAMLIYVTPADVPTVADFSRQELTGLGWREVVPANTTQEDDPTLENMTFLKGGQELSVFITVAPAQDNQTSVQYSFPTLTTQMETAPTTEPIPTEEAIVAEVEPTEEASPAMPDVPIPPDAQEVKYEADFDEITFTSATDIKKLVQFYRQELKKKDWVEEEIASVAEDTFGSLQFTKSEASLSFTMFRFDEATEVTISLDGLTAAVEPSGDDTEASTTEGSTPSGSDEPLVAEDKDGLPVPSNYGNFSSEGTDYRRMITTDVPAPVKAVVEFYNRELAAKNWAALPSTVGPTDNEATMMFENPAEEAQLEVKLTKNSNDGTDINLLFKSVGAAKKDGILPPAGQARLYFGNINEGSVTFSINQKEIKVEPQDPGQKSMKGVPNIDLPPGEYEYTLTIPGEPPVSDKVQVGADETWGLIGGPGGAFPVQIY
ncbi:MAG: hypothetical protein U0401_05500 [Anaerolineae bacterium]